MSVFLASPLPTTVDTVADLATPKARTADGKVVTTTGRTTPGDNGGASYIYRRSGRTGVTTDGGAFVIGPGTDDYWEVTRKDRLDLSIYEVDKTAFVSASAAIQAADAIPGETLWVAEGTYLIDSNITLTRRVEFDNGAMFNIANGFTLTLSAGYVAQNTQQVFNTLLGGVVEVENMEGVSVAHWGAVPDHTFSPDFGTNNSPLIQAAFDACNQMAGTFSSLEPRRPEVFVPPGSYRLLTGVVLKNRCNLYAPGATFWYWGSQASDGAILTIGEDTGTLYEEIELGTFTLPSVSGNPSKTQITVAEEEFVGVRIDECGSSVFYCELTNYVAIGMQLRPNVGSYVAHNHFLNHKSWNTKWHLDFVWEWNQDIAGWFGWANENVFTNCNWTQDGSTIWYGTTAGCRMRCINARPDLPTWDFGGCNNNRFFGQCYQPAVEFGYQLLSVGLYVSSGTTYLHPTNGRNYVCSVTGVIATLPSNTDLGLSPADANGVRFTDAGSDTLSTRLIVGKSVAVNRRYFNPETRQEYICDVAGTVATVPTNTALDQSPADANGVRFTHRGPYFHAGVYLDKNGGFNMWHGTRWEYGDGAFCYIANSGNLVGNTSRGNEIVLYDYARQNSYELGKVLIDDYTLARANSLCGMKNTARLYGVNLDDKHTINDIHKRVVCSDTGICVRGMQWYNYSTHTVADFANYGFENWRLLKNAFYELTSQLLGVIVDITDTKRVGAMKLSQAPHPPTTIPGSPSIAGNTSGVPLNSLNQRIVVSSNTSKDCISNGALANNIWNIGGEPLYFSSGTNPDCTRAFICTGGGNGSMSTHLELYNVPGGSPEVGNLTIVTPDDGRFSTGTPTGGFFLERNEFIRHYTTEAFSSSGWRVRTPGVLARPWTNASAVEETELRRSGPTQAFTPNATTNTLTAVAHGLNNGDTLWLTGLDLPLGLTSSTVYYVIEKTNDTLKLSLSRSGSVVDFTDNGDFTMLLMPTATADKIYVALNSSLTNGGTAPSGGAPVIFTADDTGDTINYNDHGLANGTKVKFNGIDIPAPLVADTVYYVVGTATNTFQVSETLGGAAINLTDVGSNNPTYSAIVNDGVIDWEWYSVTAELEEVYEGAAMAAGQPAITGDLLIRSDGTSGNWHKANTYISQKTYSGDFDITLRFGDEDAGASGQSHIIGVTTDTALGDFNNYLNFDYGVMWFTGALAQVYRRANIDNYAVTWGNRLIRLVRTGTTIDLYVNDTLVAMESAVFTANAGTDVLTSVAHGLDDGRPIRFEGVDLADGLVDGTVYYVRDAAVDTFRVAATIGGTAIDLLDVGSGTQTFFTNAISSADMHVIYSAFDTTDSQATIYNDDYKPTTQGGALVATLTPIQPVSDSETITSIATPVFRWTVFPGRTKSMTLTTNVTAMTLLVEDPGEYTIVFTQDATGGRTVVWPVGIEGTAPTLNLLGGETTIFNLFYTGTKWLWGNIVTDERVNVAIVSDGGGVAWDTNNTYISNDQLAGNFDITFEFVDRQQMYIAGVTASTLAVPLNNYNTFTFGVFWVNDTTVQVWKGGVSANHAIATWGNGLARIVRTGSNIDLYINNALVAAATDAAFGTATQRRIYTAAANTGSDAIIYGDLSVPIASGANLTRVNTALADENGTETVTFSATAAFNFAVDPRRNKKMTLTANATGLIVLAPTPGTYFIALTQDGTGSHTVAWATTINGTAPTMSAGAGTSTLFPIYSNGTDLFWA